jgi:hypothetical protein
MLNYHVISTSTEIHCLEHPKILGGSRHQEVDSILSKFTLLADILFTSIMDKTKN